MRHLRRHGCVLNREGVAHLLWLNSARMRVTCFADTDAALIELSDKPSVETRELGEDLTLTLTRPATS